MIELLVLCLIVSAIVYSVGAVFGAIGYSVSDEACKGPLNVWSLLFRGAAWPLFLARRLADDAGKLSQPKAKLPKPYQKLFTKLKPQDRLPRSGQESGLYE